MTVSTTTSRVQYGTNGTTGPWTVPFKFLQNSHLQVVYADASGAETILALTTDYSVTGAGAETGTVTTVAAFASGGTLTIVRSVPSTQETDYGENDPFPANTHEMRLDWLTMLLQQQSERLDRAIVFPVSDDATPLLPPSSVRSGRLNGFDSGGALTTYPIGSGNSTNSSDMSYISDAAGAVGRVAQGKLRERVSILDFAPDGALGAGQNATAALLAAVAYVNDSYSNNNFKKQVFLPAGDYLFSRVELQSLRGITFIGENTMDAIKRKTRWLFSGPAGDAALVVRSCAWVHFKGIHFENATENMQHLVLFSANDANASAPLNKFSNNWVTFEDCVFLSGSSLVTPPSKLVWQKSCSNVAYLRCAFRPGKGTVALKIGADTDVDPDNGLPTFANGISAITVIDQCYFWGDIERQKSYSTIITNSQFSVHDNGDGTNSRMTISGAALTIMETIENNTWDPSNITTYTGTLIEGGTSAECRGLRVVSNQLTGRLNLIKVNRGDAVIESNRPIAYGGSSSNVFLQIEANAGNVRCEGNNEPGYIVDTVPGTVKAKMLVDNRASKFGPVIAASEVPNAVTLPAAAAFQSIRSQSHQFAGGWVRFTYSITIQHKDGGNTRAYTSRLTIGGTLVAGSVRRASATVLDEYIVLAMSHIVYVDASDQALTISLEVQQGSGAANFGIVSGADTPARSTWLVELMTH